MHRTTTTIAVTETADAAGAAIVRVPLAGGGHATLDAADYHRLIREGVSSCWTLNEAGPGLSYVRVGNAAVAGRLEVVARLIMQPGCGVVVRYVGGDRTNLRRTNLRLVKGRAPGQRAAAKRKGTAHSRSLALREQAPAGRAVHALGGAG